MEKEQRNRLQKATQEARRLLEEEFAGQLLEIYDINVAAGHWNDEPGTHLQAEQRLIREKLVSWIEHRSAQINDEKEALLLTLREMAFTALNRFVALKLMEARELVRPCVSGGMESEGFQEFTAVAQGLVADQEGTYRLYLQAIFEDVSRELRALFDPRDPASILWPKRTALLDLLEILNCPELADLWIKDETLGWVYQYFNSRSERQEMRKSSAPRNSRELAVRNQFFTPRYVVEFLTDNTLGRIWYEMLQGKTMLKEICRYLVRSPNEVWLHSSEEPLIHSGIIGPLSQEELLHEPEHIQHRTLKDPREIRTLDPACGSMHFGLYAFDLYLAIYEEAWELATNDAKNFPSTPEFLGFVEFASKFPDRKAFLREVPYLILQHNIHGVDIDSRATQIARLTLWLRAQRCWQDQHLEISSRPHIKRSNIVCSEPMPGENDQLLNFVQEQFSASEQAPYLRILRAIFDKMVLAGDAGPLLRIEEEIIDEINNLQSEWLRHSAHQHDLFAFLETVHGPGIGRVDSRELLSIADSFWIDLEANVYTALGKYAAKAEKDYRYERGLFVDDASQGFAFIDACRLRYDVVLMNPPFGEPSIRAKTYLDQWYQDSKSDIDAMFVEAASRLVTSRGLIGGIYNRSQFSKGTLTDWRKRRLYGNHSITLCLDLGFGVLDGATVEAAAYTTKKPSSARAMCTVLSALSFTDKQSAVDLAIESLSNRSLLTNVYVILLDKVKAVPGSRFAYWIHPELLDIITNDEILEGGYAYARQGLITADNERFLRLAWEVNTEHLSSKDVRELQRNSDPVSSGEFRKWFFYSKGGDYSPYYADLHLVVNWMQNGFEICNYMKNGVVASRPQNTQFFLKPAITYSERTASDFSPRILPSGCIFDCKGPIVAPIENSNEDYLLALQSLLASKTYKYFVELSLGGADSSSSIGTARQYTQSIVGGVPVPRAFTDHIQDLSTLTKKIWELHYGIDSLDETSRFYSAEALARISKTGSLLLVADQLVSEYTSIVLEVLTNTLRVENLIFMIYGLSDSAIATVYETCGLHPLLRDCLDLSASQDTQRLLSLEVDPLIDAIRETGVTSRSITKKSFYVDRRLEVLCSALDVNAVSVLDNSLFSCPIVESTRRSLAYQIVHAAVAIYFGYYDTESILSRASDSKVTILEMPPTSPPIVAHGSASGGLHEKDGMRQSFAVIDAGYSGPQSLHVDSLITAGLGISHESIEQALMVLGVKTLSDYVSTPSLFFDEHCSRHSRSRRQAPIFWLLSLGPATSGTKILLCYHTISKDTIYRVLNDFIGPEIERLERELLKHDASYAQQPTEDSRATCVRRIDDLKSLGVELGLIAPLWSPDQDDGVLINHSLLWRLAASTPWQKRLKETWSDLQSGHLDWSAMAFRLWPRRVLDKCKIDRSIAIAHGIDDDLWQTPPGCKPRVAANADEIVANIYEATSNATREGSLRLFLDSTPQGSPARGASGPRAARSRSTSAPRRPRASTTAIDAEAALQTMLVLTAAPAEGLGRNAIADLLDVEAASLTAVIKQLKEGGQIEQLGAARGAKYRLTEQGRAAVESQAGEDE